MKFPYCQMSFKQISKHRTFLYGFAALWIMLFHFSTYIPSVGVLIPLRFIQVHGNAGVEIFVVLSGFGLYNSMEKSSSIGEFYKKRLLRVFLPACIVLAFYNTLVDESFVSYIANTTFLGYWFGYYAIWYIPFILTMYLIYPIIFKIQNRNANVLYIFLLFALVLSFVCETLRVDINILRGVSRIPIFLVGCILTPQFKKNAKIPNWVFPVALLGSVVFSVFENRQWALRYDYFYDAAQYFFFSIFLIITLTYVAELLLQHKFCCELYRIFAFCGTLSLEFYLLFERCRFVCDYLPGFDSDPYNFIKKDLASIIATVVLSVVLQRLTQLLITTFQSIHIPTTNQNNL